MAGIPSNNGSNLETKRKECGMSQGDIARATGLSITTISRWECGRNIPTKESLQRVAEILKCDWKDLVD